ncbi:SDR family oxidoreductase [Sphaerimonospora sp. CA-214678]|uniref:SDR family oxidoreductase n=1 Tax=Sphaerimonospora sp. CA-214678 TaxID=3240029 RepID=UPI003D8B8CE5
MASLSGVDGKGIVVTGGGGGLGSAMAAELCRLGARVVVCGRTQETLDRTVEAIGEELGEGRAFAVTADVRDPASVAAMADAAGELLGAVDGLVNNASGLFPIRAEELTPNGFNSVIQIVLNGTWHCTSEMAGRWLSAGRGGAVVNVLTPYAWMGAPGIVHNASAKGGVLAMTRTLGAEWAGRGVRVNAVAPGWMPVGGTDFLAGDPEVRRRLIEAIPAGRLLKAEETARAVAYLLSDDASYVVGEVLTIDGGHHLSKGLYEFLGEIPTRR